MSKYDGSTIELLNWEKYNPRMDSKRPSWFRLETSFCSGQAYFDLPPGQKWGWVMLMSSACEKNGQPFSLSYKWLRMFSNLTNSEIDEMIEYFEQKGTLRVTRASVARDSHEARNVTERDSPATDGRTDGRDETDGTDESMSAGADALVEIWNAHCGALSKARATDKRKKAIKARLKDQPDLFYWRKVVERMASSDFCQGKNDKGWRASFDFLLQPDTHVKVMEGKYDNRSADLGARPNASNPIEAVISGVSKYSSGRHLAGDEWEAHKRKIQDAVGADAWALIQAFGGWQKIHDAASNPIGLRMQLKELARGAA